jgi:hypothetical protein
MTQREQFAKLNGIKWHRMSVTDGARSCSCGVSGNLETIFQHACNPTFSDAKSILEVMKARNDYRGFVRAVGDDFGKSGRISEFFIEDYYILNPDKLLTEAINWCEQHQKEEVNED